MSNSKNVFAGESVDVTFDGKRCIHVGECGRSGIGLFVGGRKPWCDPNQVEVDQVTDVVERCPTGALTYERKDGGPAEAAPAFNKITVAPYGPVYVHGSVEVVDPDGNKREVAHRVALCRCGASKNKPFCDGAHEKIEFKDQAAVGSAATSEALEMTGDLTISECTNGPLLLKGKFALYAGSGRLAMTAEKGALCRCGASKNKPFCDGAHSSIGFDSSK